MNAIETQELTYTYSKGTPFEKTAVDRVTLAIEKGSYVGVIGHTGSGKSTLIQHFNGLLQPTSGKVLVGGQDIWADKSKLRQFRFQVGLVFQYPEYQLFGETVYSDIAFGPGNMGLDPDEINQRVHQSARFVGLTEDQLQKSPFELSGGQKRRVAIAGVLAMDPEVLILDEPTAGLDPKGRDQILGEIREYHEEKKNTILLVSHSMEDIARYANRALVMNHSHLFAYDTVEGIFSRAEELSAMGLAIPQVSRVFLELSRRGAPVSPNVYTVDQAVRELLGKLEKGGDKK
ncbi:energy-coupling factor transporter ATPase [Angelakisella massiliensis]|uniref:energy-coupling factor transporter ATPase n=1 Tax=Angelakisella massiliensis TaxID=1871018 RepID=UPI0023A79773|nr:energy-coupling factor transporter ATPase [Angelakisella massiliensis]